MAILRINKSKNYVTMSNYHFKEKEMSLKAKGLLSEMLSLPDDWDYSIAGLVAINKENECAIKSTLNELKDFGYVKVTKVMPNETKSGRIEYIYDIFEKKQEGEKQGVENLGVEFLGVENQGQYNINNKNINNKNIKDNKEKYKKEKQERVLLEQEFERLWSIYPNKQGKIKALEHFIKVRKKGVDFDTILKGLENYNEYIKQTNKSQQYIKQGSTWFNQECWNDEYTREKTFDEMWKEL